MDFIIELLDERWAIVGEILNAFNLYFDQIRITFGVFDKDMFSTWSKYVQNNLTKPVWVTSFDEMISQYDILKYHDIGVSFSEFILSNTNYLEQMKYHKTETTVIELTHTNRNIRDMIENYFKKVPIIDTKIIEHCMQNHDYKKQVEDRLPTLKLNKFIVYYMMKNINDEYRNVFAQLRNISLFGQKDERRIKIFPTLDRNGLVPVTRYTSRKYLFAMIDKPYDENLTFEENCNVLSEKESVGIVIIKSVGEDIEYSSRSILDKKYIAKNRMMYSNYVGLNDNMLKKYDTIHVQSRPHDKKYDIEIVVIGNYSKYLVVRNHNSSYKFLHNRAFELDVNFDNLLVDKQIVLNLIEGQTILHDMKNNEMEKLIMTRCKNKSFIPLITQYQQYAASDEKQKLPLLKTRILENWKNRLTHAMSFDNVDDLIEEIVKYKTINAVVTDAHEKTFEFKLDIAMFSSDSYMMTEYTKILRTKIYERKKFMKNIVKNYPDKNIVKQKLIDEILAIQSDVIDICIKNNVFISEDISLLKFMLRKQS